MKIKLSDLIQQLNKYIEGYEVEEEVKVNHLEIEGKAFSYENKKFTLRVSNEGSQDIDITRDGVVNIEMMEPDDTGLKLKLEQGQIRSVEFDSRRYFNKLFGKPKTAPSSASAAKVKSAATSSSGEVSAAPVSAASPTGGPSVTFTSATAASTTSTTTFTLSSPSSRAPVLSDGQNSPVAPHAASSTEAPVATFASSTATVTSGLTTPGTDVELPAPTNSSGGTSELSPESAASAEEGERHGAPGSVSSKEESKEDSGPPSTAPQTYELSLVMDVIYSVLNAPKRATEVKISYENKESSLEFDGECKYHTVIESEGSLIKDPAKIEFGTPAQVYYLVHGKIWPQSSFLEKKKGQLDSENGYIFDFLNPTAEVVLRKASVLQQSHLGEWREETSEREERSAPGREEKGEREPLSPRSAASSAASISGSSSTEVEDAGGDQSPPSTNAAPDVSPPEARVAQGAGGPVSNGSSSGRVVVTRSRAVSGSGAPGQPVAPVLGATVVDAPVQLSPTPHAYSTPTSSVTTHTSTSASTFSLTPLVESKPQDTDEKKLDLLVVLDALNSANQIITRVESVKVTLPEEISPRDCPITPPSVTSLILNYTYPVSQGPVMLSSGTTIEVAGKTYFLHGTKVYVPNEYEKVKKGIDAKCVCEVSITAPTHEEKSREVPVAVDEVSRDESSESGAHTVSPVYELSLVMNAIYTQGLPSDQKRASEVKITYEKKENTLDFESESTTHSLTVKENAYCASSPAVILRDPAKIEFGEPAQVYYLARGKIWRTKDFMHNKEYHTLDTDIGYICDLSQVIDAASLEAIMFPYRLGRGSDDSSSGEGTSEEFAERAEQHEEGGSETSSRSCAEVLAASIPRSVSSEDSPRSSAPPGQLLSEIPKSSTLSKIAAVFSWVNILGGAFLLAELVFRVPPLSILNNLFDKLSPAVLLTTQIGMGLVTCFGISNWVSGKNSAGILPSIRFGLGVAGGLSALAAIPLAIMTMNPLFAVGALFVITPAIAVYEFWPAGKDPKGSFSNSTPSEVSNVEQEFTSGCFDCLRAPPVTVPAPSENPVRLPASPAPTPGGDNDNG